MNDTTDHQPHYQANFPLPPQTTGTPPQHFAPPKKRRRWLHFVVHFIGYLTVFIIGLAIGGSGDGSSPTSSEPGATVTVTKPAPPAATKTVTGPTRTVTAQPAGPSDTIKDDGTWLVGSEVKPGTYRSQNFGDCYWARLSSTDGGLNAIIDNGVGPNQTVTIKRSDKAFETARCGVWKRIR